MKEKLKLDLFDFSDYPKDFKKYLKSYGFHFNKKACEEAVKGLKRKNPATGKNEPIEPKPKEEVEQSLQKHGIILQNNAMYDFVWVFNMCYSDYWKSSIEDEAHLARITKDIIDDPDQPDGFIFNRWVSDRMFAGCPIEWGDLI